MCTSACVVYTRFRWPARARHTRACMFACVVHTRVYAVGLRVCAGSRETCLLFLRCPSPPLLLQPVSFTLRGSAQRPGPQEGAHPEARGGGLGGGLLGATRHRVLTDLLAPCTPSSPGPALPGWSSAGSQVWAWDPASREHCHLRTHSADHRGVLPARQALLREPSEAGSVIIRLATGN